MLVGLAYFQSRRLDNCLVGKSHTLPFLVSRSLLFGVINLVLLW